MSFYANMRRRGRMNRWASISETDDAFIDNQTINNPEWIQQLEQIIDVQVGDPQPIAQNTVFLSPVWSPPSTGAPYFTDLQAALDHVAAQNPQPESPWTIIIYPGLYQDGMMQAESDQIATNGSACQSKLAFAKRDPLMVPMCDRNTLRQIVRIKDQLHQRENVSACCRVATRSINKLHRTDHAGSPKMIAYDEAPIPEDELAAHSSITNKHHVDNHDIRPMAQRVLPVNLTLHALAKYTVVIGDDLSWNNAGKPQASQINFENIIFTGLVDYVRDSVSPALEMRLDNCNFLTVQGQTPCRLSLRDVTEANLAERFSMRDCLFSSNTYLDLFLSGLNAKLRSCTLQNAELTAGNTTQGRENVIVSLDAIESASCRITVGGTSRLDLAGDLPGATVTGNDTSVVNLNNVDMDELNLRNGASATGQASLQSIILQDTSLARLSGKTTFVNVAPTARFDLIGLFHDTNLTGTFNPTWRAITVPVQASWSNPITVNLGTSYSNANFYSIWATIENGTNPSDANAVQIVSRSVSSFQINVLPIRNYPLTVFCLVNWNENNF